MESHDVPGVVGSTVAGYEGDCEETDSFYQHDHDEDIDGMLDDDPDDDKFQQLFAEKFLSQHGDTPVF